MGWEIAVIGITGVIGAAAGAISAAVSAGAQQRQAEFQSKLAARNAKQQQIYANLARNQAAAAAQATENETQAQVDALRRRHAIELSENRSLIGASGLQNSGSNLLFNIDNAITAAVDEQNILINGRYRSDLQRYEGEVNAYKHEVQAGNYKAQSEYYDDAADAYGAQKVWGSIMGGVQGGLSGASAGMGLAGGAVQLGLLSPSSTFSGSKSGNSLFGLGIRSAGA